GLPAAKRAGAGAAQAPRRMAAAAAAALARGGLGDCGLRGVAGRICIFLPQRLVRLGQFRPNCGRGRKPRRSKRSGRGVRLGPWPRHFFHTDRSAAVLRVWPAQLQVRLTERTPVALARAGSSLRLVDGGGVLLTAPEKGNFDFPVLSGLAGAEAANPDARRWLQTRAPQMERFAAFRDALAQGGKLSEEISE